jgi:hypothetical protein
MIGLVRAATIVATMAFALVAAQAADKAFKRDDLNDSAIRLAAQIKTEAGPINKSASALKADADAAFKRNDYRAGLVLLGQIAAVAPEDGGNWLRLARTIFLIRPADSREQTFLYERASTAAYIGYQRATNAGDEADALAVLGNAMQSRHLWRPALDALRMSLDLKEVADIRGQYEKLREEQGFRRVFGCSTIPSIRIRRRPGSASSSPKRCRNAPTTRRSWRLPAPTSRRCPGKTSNSASRD